MQIEQIYRYAHDAHQAYQACLNGLHMQDSGAGLSTLLNAVRKREISGRGEVTCNSDHIYQYHVHGGGYSFNNVVNGKIIHFDVKSVDGIDRIHFPVWKFYKYLESIGELTPQDTVASELRRLSETGSYLVRVCQPPFEYFYCDEGKITSNT